MKPSLFLSTSSPQPISTPTKGINPTLKNSLIFPSVKSSTLIPSPVHHQELTRQFQSKPQSLLENPTTYDNSLAKPNKPHNSIIKLNLLQSTSKPITHSHSQSKRKKFISVTQRTQQSKFPISQKIHNTQQRRSSALETSKSPSQVNPFSTFKQLLTPASTLKQYWASMIETFSNGDSKVESREEAFENIMSEDVLPMHKDFSVAEKARLQRKTMMNSLIFNETHGKISNQRAHTEVDEFRPMIREYTNLVTEPECPVDSRNFAVFEQKIGQNTLTRKDSLILALMDELQFGTDGINQNQQEGLQNIVSQQLIESVNLNEIESTKKYQELIGKEIQNKPEQIEETERKKSGLKGNRIKCISLIEKQQSYKYRNSRNQPELEGQFIEMKKKVSKKA